MSNAATGIAWHHSAASTQSMKLILIKIADMDGDGGAWPSMQTLADAAMITKDSARKLVRQLEELGEIKTHLNEGGGIRTQKHMRTNVYEFLLRCPWYCDGSAAHKDLRDDKNARIRPGNWSETVTFYTGDTPSSPALPPSPGTGAPSSPALPNHHLTTHNYQDTSSNLSLVDVREEENTAEAHADRSGYEDWHPGQKIAQAIAQAAAVAAPAPVKRPDYSKPTAPIAKVPPAPHVPRYQPETPTALVPPRAPEIEAAIAAASQLECPEGFGNGKFKNHAFPQPLTGCWKCAREALDLAAPPLLDQEATE